MSLATLKQLSKIISDSIESVEKRCNTLGYDYPSLDKPFNPADPAESLTVDPIIIENVMILIAASNQIVSTTRLPAMTLFDMSMSFHLSSALQVIALANIPEILREAGPQGLHAKDIATKTFLDAELIARYLRLLASHHVFRELTPDVFTNNRLSSMLDTLKSVKEINANPVNRHVGSPGLKALIEHTQVTDETFKGSAIVADFLMENPGLEDPADAPIVRAQNARKPFFEWLEESGNESRSKRFGAAMAGVSKLDDGTAILRGYPWAELPENAKVVDVGSGIGDMPMILSKNFPTFKFVLQDFAGVMGGAREHWEVNNPSALNEGRIEFLAHDFFKPQPVKDADLFLLRMITHDWGSSHVITILKHLREAAVPGKTKLLIVDQIAPYACSVPNDEGRNIPGPPPPSVPDVLLPNLGKANSIIYLGDLQMFTLQYGQERTIGNHIDVTHAAGWKIVRLYRPSASIFAHILAEPI
ncbi:hypothetical protein Clacol_006026 [Clathrus columnatus]|uniref:O-methyltransferase domain-containing protein n=1 Tax=Clathrus columnatus TaxID=1419009 RepID=A0AAV5AGH7_9AGAM|nr:hypothetical protein Clacol_006026 [Clathrus columnatus]